jgi:formate hydrogenlyase subunit 6/NADH:ubiquinone oxidoreductase subunit I
MSSGPKVSGSFDLALTEILQGTSHYFVAEEGSEKGNAVLKEVPHSPADTADVETAEQLVRQAAAKMGRTLDATNIRELLYQNLEHRRWEEVAGRCLTCANCTMVCPTCFCTTVEEATDLKREYADRRRRWDSCFTMDFSYIHGGYIRPSVKSRYRQWMTHKLASWMDQFGVSGCVGCGRCITWCPVGIDITEEVKTICRDAAAPEPAKS